MGNTLGYMPLMDRSKTLATSERGSASALADTLKGVSTVTSASLLTVQLKQFEAGGMWSTRNKLI